MIENIWQWNMGTSILLYNDLYLFSPLLYNIIITLLFLTVFPIFRDTPSFIYCALKSIWKKKEWGGRERGGEVYRGTLAVLDLNSVIVWSLVIYIKTPSFYLVISLIEEIIPKESCHTGKRKATTHQNATKVLPSSWKSYLL